MPLVKLLLAHKIIAIISASVLILAGGGTTLFVLSHQQPKISTTTSTQKSSPDSSSSDTDTEKDDKKDSTKKSDAKKTSPTKPKSSSGSSTAPKSTSPTSNTGGGTSSPAPSSGTTPSTPSGGFKANCISVPSACGYPDASNTGPKGSLTNSGTVTVTTNGAVVQNLNVSGQIRVRANNVTIRNVRLTSGDYYPIEYQDGRTGLVVEDTEVIGTSTGVTSFGPFANYTARRVEVYGGADGFKADSNVLIEHSYIHNLRVTASSHNDGTQAYGGSNVTIRHNTYKLSGTNAEVLQFNATNTNWTIENNLFDGGGWVFNAGSLNGSVIRGNRFTRTQGYGIAQVAGATYSNNYYDDNGAAIQLK